MGHPTRSGEAFFEEVAGYGVEDSVQKVNRLWSGVAASYFEGLVDDDGARGVGVFEELGDGGAEEVPVNYGHAFDAPVLGVGFDECVDLGLAGGSYAVDVVGEAAGLGVYVIAGGPE